MKNQTLGELYMEYRDRLDKLIAKAENRPRDFENVTLVEQFGREFDKLDALIYLYADLLASNNAR